MFLGEDEKEEEEEGESSDRCEWALLFSSPPSLWPIDPLWTCSSASMVTQVCFWKVSAE